MLFSLFSLNSLYSLCWVSFSIPARVEKQIAEQGNLLGNYVNGLK